MRLDRLVCVLRTRRLEAAPRSQSRRDASLVQADRPQQHHSHRAASAASNLPRRAHCRNACSSSPYRAIAAFCRAVTTMSYPGTRAVARVIARKRRRTRFRVTALPTRFPTAKPTRLCSSPLGRNPNPSSGCRTRCPSWSTSKKSWRRVSLVAGGTVAGGAAADSAVTNDEPLDGQTCPSTRPAALEHVAPPARRHAGSEPVLAQTGDSLRLPGPFHRTLL